MKTDFVRINEPYGILDDISKKLTALLVLTVERMRTGVTDRTIQGTLPTKKIARIKIPQ